MSAFYNGYQGDDTSLKLVIDNINEKSILVPGVTCADGIDVSEAGDSCYYFKRAASSLSYGKAGSPMSINSVGVTRIDFALDYAIKFADVIPTVRQLSTINVVSDRVKQNTIEAINMHNKKALAFLMANGTDIQDYTDLTVNNVYEKFVDIIEDFRLNNKAKGLDPSAVFVSNAATKLLVQSNFLRFAAIPDTYKKYTNIIGVYEGIPVFEAPDMDDDADYDFICLHHSAFVAPLNVNFIKIQDGANAGYPHGKIVSGEFRTGFSIADAALVLYKKNSLQVAPPNLEWDSTGKIVWSDVSHASSYIMNDNGTPQAEQTDKEYTPISITTTESYYKAKSKSTEAGYESESAYSEALTAQKRSAPTISLDVNDKDKVDITADPSVVAGQEYYVYVDGVKHATKCIGDFFWSHNYSGTDCTITVTGAEKIIDSKYWAESATSNSISYHIPRVLSFTAAEHGSVDKPDFAVVYGMKLIISSNTLTCSGKTVTATPAAGYVFGGWYFTSSGTRCETGDQITSDTAIEARFTTVPSGILMTWDSASSSFLGVDTSPTIVTVGSTRYDVNVWIDGQVISDETSAYQENQYMRLRSVWAPQDRYEYEYENPTTATVNATLAEYPWLTGTELVYFTGITEHV